MQIQPKEQQQLLDHSRAITERLPDEMNPIAVGQSEAIGCEGAAMPVLPANVVAFPTRETMAKSAASANQNECDRRLTTFFSSSPSFPNSKQLQAIAHDDSSTIDSAPIPTDSDGFAENPYAYKPWKQKPLEEEVVTPQQFREKLAAMVQRLSMG